MEKGRGRHRLKSERFNANSDPPFVTGTTPAPKRGAANATYLLSYDIGIGIGSFVMGLFQESIGISTGFAVTAVAYIFAALLYALFVDSYYTKLVSNMKADKLL